MTKRYIGPFVSRGGEKLSGALDVFSYDVSGKRVLDVGASTGGFTDCLLQRGAAEVTALDVAYGQFAWKLRQDPRVTVVERTNFKTYSCTSASLNPTCHPERNDVRKKGSSGEGSCVPQAGVSDGTLCATYDLVVADLSFIALGSLTAQFKAAVGESGDLILLVKPQFEARREEVGDGGVIYDSATHVRILKRLAETYVAAGLPPQVWTHSPLKGPKGNIEFWMWARPEAASENVEKSFTSAAACASIEGVVKQAHEVMGQL